MLGASRHIQKTNRPFVIPIFIPHAGCPHRCVFCDQSSITGVRSNQPQKDIRGKIEAFLKFKSAQRGDVQIAFFGGNFLGMPADEIKRLLAEASVYVESRRVNSIRFSSRPDTIDHESLDLISNFPVATIELGVQSMNDRVLSVTKRGHSAEDTEKAIQQLKRLHYEIGVQLMVGLPGDTPEQLLVSARRIARLKPDFVRIYPTLVIGGSSLARWYQSGTYMPLSLEEAVTQTKNLYLLFRRENIRVIRMGLQATADLDEGSTILAGPYHPAFGHQVYSEIFLDMAVKQIESTAFNRNSILIRVNPKSVSRLQGLRSNNIEILKKKFGFESVAVRPDDALAEDQLKISSPL